MKDVRSILDQNAYRFDGTAGGQTDELVRRRLETVGPTSVLFYREPLHIVQGQGVWLYDSSGQAYLDVYNNVPSVGHCHPKVVEAVSKQMAQLNVHTRYLHDGIHRYTERLLATMPESLNRMVMTCTGSESNDLALRLVRHWTGREGIIVTEAAYHGNTTAVTEVSPSSLKQREPADHVHVIPISSMPSGSDEAGAWFEEQVRAGIERLDRAGFGCAAVLIDTIFSSDGIFADPEGFLGPAVDLLRDHGGMLIADEVQPGFGRTGNEMWGFARHGLVPDVVTMGKPMGNGYPVAGLVANQQLLELLNAEAGYFNTFGGSQVSVAAATAVLDILEDEGLQDNARVVGGYLKASLKALASRHACIGDIRGAGLFIGVDIVDAESDGQPDAETATRLINELRKNGVLLGAAGRSGNILKVRPPLCFTRENADLFVDRLESALIMV